MPIDDLTALEQKMREARKHKELTQQELSDLSHVSVKQIANIEQGKTNSSYLILRALAKVLLISLDTLINPDISLEDEGVNHEEKRNMAVNKNGIVVLGAVFVDIKGFPEDIYGAVRNGITPPYPLSLRQHRTIPA